MDEIRAASARVRNWTIVVTTLYYGFYTAPWVLVICLSLTGHKGWLWGGVVFTFYISIYLAHRYAQKRLKKACEEHPLIFLVKVQEAFGAS